MSDLITRQAAIDAKNEFRNPNVLRDNPFRTAYDRVYAKGWNDCNSAFIKNIEELPPAQPEQQWIPLRQAYNPDTRRYEFSCDLPDNGERILVSIDCEGDRFVQEDVWYGKERFCYLDSGYDPVADAVAWMPMPPIYQEESVSDD